jgi:hypothetical protein
MLSVAIPFLRQHIRSTHRSSETLSSCGYGRLTVHDGGTVLKNQNRQTRARPLAAAAVDHASSDVAVLRLARLIGRQLARDVILNDRSTNASSEDDNAQA